MSAVRVMSSPSSSRPRVSHVGGFGAAGRPRERSGGSGAAHGRPGSRGERRKEVGAPRATRPRPYEKGRYANEALQAMGAVGGCLVNAWRVRRNPTILVAGGRAPTPEFRVSAAAQ